VGELLAAADKRTCDLPSLPRGCGGLPYIAHEAFERARFGCSSRTGKSTRERHVPGLAVAVSQRPIAVNCKSWQRRCPLAVPEICNQLQIFPILSSLESSAMR